jgi:2',3'-cyclic-nucleotide 2'-phosphodiesterase (5'-nucleotidase family)
VALTPLTRARWTLIAAALLWAALAPTLPPFSNAVRAQQEDAASPRARAPLTILQLNDVYSTLPVDDVGGLARVATMKKRLAAAGRTPLLVLAGDFLSPSVASSVFKGEQMVAALNAAGLDLATLGNHEFDFGTDVLIQRMAEARWQWVISNVIDTNTGKPIGGAAPYLVRQFGALKVGFIGLCLTSDEINYAQLKHVRFIDPLTAAGPAIAALKREGANVIVAVTHLEFADDRTLATRFPDIDLIVGGHEHYPVTATENRTLISKAGSDARYVARIDIDRRPGGPVERFFELLPVTSAIPDDPRTAEVAAAYDARLGTALEEAVGTSRVALDAETVRLRASETNIGNLVADAMRADVDADIAIINSGAIRGDRIYKEGPLTRRTLIGMHPFGNVICKVEVPGRVVLQALNSGVSKLPATAGQFPQVSGLTMRVEPAAPVGSRVQDVRVHGEPLDPNKRYTVAIADFMLSGGDGYTMFGGQRVLIGPASGNLLVSALERYVAAKGEIAPSIERRIVIQ